MNLEQLKLRNIVNAETVDIGGTTEVSDIPRTPEQQFFLLLKGKLPPTTKITYEPEQFIITDDEEKSYCTTPDFKIEKPNGVILYIETTLAEKNGKDPKQTQKWIMSNFQQIHYVVLYKHNLENIERQHPEVSFRHSKRIRR